MHFHTRSSAEAIDTQVPGEPTLDSVTSATSAQAQIGQLSATDKVNC